MKYTVLSSLKHNGEQLNIGDSIELSKEVATPLLRDGILSNAKVPVIKEKDWKQGPKAVLHDSEEEVKPTGEVGKVDEESGEEETDEVQKEANESTEEATIAGAGDDTSKIDENMDANL